MRITGNGIGAVVLVAFAGWYGWTYHQPEIKGWLGLAPKPAVRILGEQFTCDKRRFCSQMTSCEEARFFVLHCADLDRDSNPGDCEKRWCQKNERGRIFQNLTE